MVFEGGGGETERHRGRERERETERGDRERETERNVKVCAQKYVRYHIACLHKYSKLINQLNLYLDKH